MALENDVVMACRSAPGAARVEVTHAQPEFGSREVAADPDAPVNVDAHDWSNYFQCGYKGAFEAARELRRAAAAGAEARPVRLQVLMTGNVPRAAGLSSSSAFVVASALATATANGLRFSRTELGELSRQCECVAAAPAATKRAALTPSRPRRRAHIGTMGGGMDQAISCLGERGCAKHIQFGPLRAATVPLPAGVAFVVVNSMDQSEKAVSAVKGMCLVVLCRAVCRAVRHGVRRRGRADAAAAQATTSAWWRAGWPPSWWPSSRA